MDRHLLLALVFSIGLNLWFVLFLYVLWHEEHELAPRRSGGGTSAPAGLARVPEPTLPTPR